MARQLSKDNNLYKTSTPDVIVAMSGGVDSTVCAFILTQEYSNVIGATMHLFDNEMLGVDKESTCCSVDDVLDAKDACRKLGIEHYTFNYKDQFKHCVIDKFCTSYANGQTPNPCIDCNRYLKLEKLQQRRRELGAKYVATGHYVRRQFDVHTGKWKLLKGADSSKDQSYVLYHLTQNDLEHMLFPLGELTKQQVREIANTQGYVNANKAESQDICFVPDGDYVRFIEHYKKLTCGYFYDTNKLYLPGDIINIKGDKLGTHSGLIGYTIGQRKGIGIAASEPLYVIDKRGDSNELVVGFKDELFVDSVSIDDVNIVSGEFSSATIDVEVKTTYRQAPVAASIKVSSNENGSTIADVSFSQPIVRPAPGQSVVFYQGDEVLGGGVAI